MRVGEHRGRARPRDRTALGPVVVDPLLALLEKEHAFESAFNERGSDEWKKHGAFSRKASLTSGAVFLIGAIGALSEAQTARLQQVLAHRSELDRGIEGKVSTLAENIARTLNGLAPGRFPKPQKDPSTNRLLNPHEYR